MVELCFVVPIYKVRYDYLHNCVNSILNQTYSNIELILVDDGSPDDCGMICDEIMKKDKRVQVIHKKNSGLSDARNAGIDVCSAKWITFVDGDDWVTPDFSESFITRVSMESTTADIYVYSGYRNYSHNEITCTPYYADGVRFVSYEEREKLQKKCCLGSTKKSYNNLFIGSAWAKVFNTRFLKDSKLYFPQIPYGEDSIFYLYSLEMACIVEYVAKPVYHYRDTDGGMVRGYNTNADINQRVYCESLFEFINIYKKDKQFVDTMYFRVFIAMQRCITQKYYNSGYQRKGLKRWNDCRMVMTSIPFKDVYKHISFWSLNRNNKIKYLLLRFKLYGLMNYSRDMYSKAIGKNSFSAK